jgi:peptide/nickel transport system substrate-binding protein
VVKDRIRNVPGNDKMWLAFTAPYPAVVDPEQFFVDE